MGVSSVALKGAKTVGKYSLKGFEKGGKFIGRNSLALLGNTIKSKPETSSRYRNDCWGNVSFWTSYNYCKIV